MLKKYKKGDLSYYLQKIKVGEKVVEIKHLRKKIWIKIGNSTIKLIEVLVNNEDSCWIKVSVRGDQEYVVTIGDLIPGTSVYLDCPEEGPFNFSKNPMVLAVEVR